MLARSEICRLRVFRRLSCPSVWPLEQGSARAAVAAAGSAVRPRTHFHEDAGDPWLDRAGQGARDGTAVAA